MGVITNPTVLVLYKDIELSLGSPDCGLTDSCWKWKNDLFLCWHSTCNC